MRTADADAERGGLSTYRLRYQEMFEFAPDGQLMTDAQGIILEANYAAVSLLQCPKHFLVGKPLGLFVAVGQRPRFYESLARLHHSATSDEFETKLGRDNDKRIVEAWVSFIAAPDGSGAALRWLLRDLTERRRVEAARDVLLRKLVTAQEDERRRVARELHDSVGQLLNALLLDVRGVRDAGPLSPRAAARLDKLERVADELIQQVHGLAIRLRPPALDDLGLEAAVGLLVSEWSARVGVQVDAQTVGLESGRLPLDIETVLYRVIQEALTNVAKHAQAQMVSVVVNRHDGHATAVIEDDGRGFNVETAGTGRLGLVGMYERVALAGGVLNIESTEGVGTTVIARVPVSYGKGNDGHV
jgi:PAS domain S-box-containing protein